MKIKITAVVLALLVFCTVTVNSLVISYNIDKIYDAVLNAPESIENAGVYESIYEDFKRRERYISITVSHEDLGDIRNSFAEVVGAYRAKNEEDLIIAKSRLTEALLHLRRLCSVNLDSIF